jgi:hypothetical protein
MGCMKPKVLLQTHQTYEQTRVRNTNLSPLVPETMLSQPFLVELLSVLFLLPTHMLFPSPDSRHFSLTCLKSSCIHFDFTVWNMYENLRKVWKNGCTLNEFWHQNFDSQKWEEVLEKVTNVFMEQHPPPRHPLFPKMNLSSFYVRELEYKIIWQPPLVDSCRGS